MHLLNGNDLYQHIRNNLNSSFDASEKNAICKSILYDLANFSMPWILEENIDSELIEKVNDAVSRINKGEPTQYVCGMAPFRHYLFLVNQHVLIPRPETEELVSLVLENLAILPTGKGLDIGTGSCAIAISISKEGLREMDALDICAFALQVAGKNVEKYGATVNLRQEDILASTLDQKYAFIVSNPPYIPAGEKDEIASSVINYEPDVALFVPDSFPLLFYDKIISHAITSLKSGGGVFFECHYKFAEQVSALLVANHFSNVQIRHDLSGKQRMVYGFYYHDAA
jgi:release factor glutamine methyltransferase